ncbi:MAG: ABC transporter permease [Acidimicrobiia bacterium]
MSDVLDLTPGAALTIPDATSQAAPVSVPKPAKKGRSPKDAFVKLGPPLVMLVLILAVYAYFSGRLATNRKFLMPSYGDLLSKGLFDGKTAGELFSGLRLTARLAVQGLLISILVGGLLGIAMFRFRWLERANYPFLVALQAIPILAIAPLLQVAFGYGMWPKTLVCVIISFFPIPTTLLLGLRSVDQGMVDLFRLQGASWFTTLRKLALPNAMPSLFAGFRISAGLSVIGAIVGELFFQGGRDGLGALIIEYRIEVHYEQMYAALLWSSALSISVFVFFNWLGNRLFSSWHESGALR